MFTGTGRALTFREHGLHRQRGIIFSDGDSWREARRFTVRTLHGQGFGRKQRNDNINDEVADVLQRLELAAERDGEVRVRHLFTLAAANSLLQLVVGQKMARDGRLQQLAELVDRNVTTLGPAYLHLDMFPWLKDVAPELSGYRQFHDDVQELVHLFQPIIDEQKATEHELETDAPPQNLIEAFIRQQRLDNKGGVFDEENLRAILKDLFMAGMETTNTEMEWVLLMLVRYPDIQTRAAAEVEYVIGHDRSPAIEDMPKLPYLEAVLEETLRLAPPIPILQHATTSGPTELGGYHIPANCRVMFDMHSVNHDRQFWGDPEAFRPERFLGEDAARLKKRMLTFGLGSRHCIGETHARQSLFLFTAGLLQRFRLRLCPGQEADLDRLEPNLILKAPNFRFTVQRRGAQEHD